VLHEDIVPLIKVAGKAAENIILAARAFFRMSSWSTTASTGSITMNARPMTLGSVSKPAFSGDGRHSFKQKTADQVFRWSIDRVADISEGVADS
jgi:hypothetical protein